MAEDTTITTTEDPPERTVPYSRFKEVNDRLADERKARTALEERMSQLEDRDKTDVERLTKELEKREKRIAEAEQRAADLEAKSMRDAKASLVANAAAKANFHDPSLAAQLLDLEGIEDAAQAERAVKALARERGYLVKSDAPEAVRLRKVGVDGQTIDPEAEKARGLVTQDELVRQWGEQMYQGLTGQQQQAASEGV